MGKTNQSKRIGRAVWPEVVFAADITEILDIDPADADTTLREGGFGPFFEVLGRPAVLRRDLLEALAGRAASEGACKEVVQPKAGNVPFRPIHGRGADEEGPR